MMKKKKKCLKFRIEKPVNKGDYIQRINKFKLNSRNSVKENQDRSTSCMNLGLSIFPNLPIPSSSLKEVLLKFNSLIEVNESSTSKSRKTIKPKTRKPVLKPSSDDKKQKRPNINGFIAFRTFYCKFVFSLEHQKQLSSLLAKLWYDEPSKDVWKTYAYGFNSCNQDQGFFEWLCSNLGIDLSGLQPDYATFIRLTPRDGLLNKIEDIYLPSNQ